jgi:hypothetical protein
MTEVERIEVVRKLARAWLHRSRWIRQAIDLLQLEYISYEEFCAHPHQCVARLSAIVPILRTADVGARIRVKISDAQPLDNKNALQIASLAHREAEAIAAELGADRELVAAFGYDADAATISRQAAT